jgi:hypothetical protein
MRLPTFALPVLAFVLGAAPMVFAAAPHTVSDVTVSIGPKLQAKASDYGQRDLDALAQELKKDVERDLSAKGRLGPGGAHLELVIADAKPNRPTFAQMGRNPSLSMRSIGIGGATIEGVETAEGSRRTLSYSWWESDIRQERGASTWSDADRVFDTFAHDYANGRR